MWLMVMGVMVMAAEDVPTSGSKVAFAAPPSWKVRFEDKNGEPIQDAPVEFRLRKRECMVGFPLDALDDEIPGRFGSFFNSMVLPIDTTWQRLPNAVASAEAEGWRVVLRMPFGGNTSEILNTLSLFAGKVFAVELVTDFNKHELESLSQIVRQIREALPGTFVIFTVRRSSEFDPITHLDDVLSAWSEAHVCPDAIGLELGVENADRNIVDMTRVSRDIPIVLSNLPESSLSAYLGSATLSRTLAGIFVDKRLSHSESVVQQPAIQGYTDKKGAFLLGGIPGDYEVRVGEHRFFPRFGRGTPDAVVLRMPPTPEPPSGFEMPFEPSRAKEWQECLRERLFALVSRQNARQDNPLHVTLGETTLRQGYAERTLTFTGNEQRTIEATLTIPAGTGPFPAVICLHGHGGSREAVHDPGTIYRGFASEFAKRGFVTLSPSLWHCDYASNQLWNLMRLVDVLETLPEVDQNRIGCAGLSMGGEWAMWLTAMDRRVRAAVVSGWLCSTEGVLSIHNCPCWMTPGLLSLCDIAEVHILIAPRPVLFESAIADECFPISCTEDAYRAVVKGYQAFSAADKVRRHVFPGGHAWNGAMAYRFMAQALTKP